MEKPIWSDIMEKGFARITAPLPKQMWQALYSDFDSFSDSISNYPAPKDAYNVEAKNWQTNSGLHMSYGGYFSPYFRDTTNQCGKDQKRIIQICEPYYRYLHEQKSPLLNNESFRRLINSMLAALYSTCSSFRPFLAPLKDIEPELYKSLNPDDRLPPVSLRLLSYNSDPRLATNPHVDKSAITVILDSDDSFIDPKIMFVENFNNTGALKLSSFKSVFQNTGESLVFMGAAPVQGGFSRFPPMPHAVAPFSGRIRHSAVFFWHLPNIDMSGFDTKIQTEDDVGLLRPVVPKRHLPK